MRQVKVTLPCGRHVLCWSVGQEVAVCVASNVRLSAEQACCPSNSPSNGLLLWNFTGRGRGRSDIRCSQHWLYMHVKTARRAAPPVGLADHTPTNVLPHNAGDTTCLLCLQVRV